MTQVILTSADVSPWTVPPDWSSTNVIDTYGAGSDGGPAANSGAGAGGAWARITNLAGLVPNGTAPFQVGLHGLTGGDSWFVSALTVMAKGAGAASGTTGGAGGAAGSSVGISTHSGGNGANNFGTFKPSGGGAAGPNGNGNAGAINAAGGSGDAGFGGAGGAAGGGAGGNGTEVDASHGSGGGGGSGSATTNGGNGGSYGAGGAGFGRTAPGVGFSGMIVINYTPAGPGPGDATEGNSIMVSA